MVPDSVSTVSHPGLASRAAGVVVLAAMILGGRTASAVPNVFLYAAPSGTSNSLCTFAQPCTLEAARDRVRQLLVSGQSSDILVYLRGGTYALPGTFRLEGQDSGVNGYNVIYSAYLSETPVLSGGKQVTGWSTGSCGVSGAWCANRDPAWSDRHLFVDGMRAVRARGWANPAGFTKTPTGYTAPDASMASWSGPMEVISHVYWKSFRCGVQSIAGQAITMKQPCWNNSNYLVGDQAYQNIQLPTWFENAKELLDEEGEAYFAPVTAGSSPLVAPILYKPRSGESMATATAIVPALETLLLLDGTVSSPVHNVQFRGLTFAYSHWGQPSTANGYPAIGSGLYTTTPWLFDLPPGAVVARSARQVRFERNVFTHLGGAGLVFESGVQDSSVVGNRFEDISSGAVTMGETGSAGSTSDANLVLRNNVVRSNYIARAGAEYHDAIGIWASHPIGLTVSHNELFDLPYTGIAVGWGTDIAAGHAPPTRETVVEGNLISHYLQTLVDGGGIYTNEPQTNSFIRRNYIHTQASDYAGLYLDNLTEHFDVRENVVADVPYWYLFQPHPGYPAQHNTLTGNYYDEVPPPQPCIPGPPPSCNVPDNTISNNVLTNEAWPPAAQQIMSEAGLEAGYKDIRLANVSRAKPTLASSEWEQGFWTAPRAVDGSAQWGWSSATTDLQSWWQVDLKAPHRIDDLELVARHRLDQPPTRHHFDVRASAQGSFTPGTFATLGSQGATPFERDDVWRPSHPTPGYFRHVRVARKPAFPEYFFVADVAVRVRASVAEGKVATASSALAGWGASGANNGSADDGWSADYAGPLPSWWQVNLGARYFISGVEIVGRPGIDQPGTRQSFEVRASNDETFATYVVIGTQGTPPFPHQGVWASSGAATTTSYRYVRVAKTDSDYFFLADVRVFGREDAAATNLALGRPAVASTVYDAGYPAPKANDGSIATSWSSSTPDDQAWWMVDLGSPMRVTRIEFVSRQDFDQPVTRRSFQIQASNDSAFASFAVLGTQGATPFPHMGTWSVDPTLSTPYRYVRIKKTETGTFLVVAELRAFGTP